jgi:hypothetical protein
MINRVVSIGAVGLNFLIHFKSGLPLHLFKNHIKNDVNNNIKPLIK